MASILRQQNHTIINHEDTRDELVKTLKREVKQIMEESVTRKFVHEESSIVNSLAAAVEACLLHGLKRRVLGLFASTSTFALLHKIAKNCSEADMIVKLMLEHQKKTTEGSSNWLPAGSSFHSFDEHCSRDTPSSRYLWIRLALFEKVLAAIVDHIAMNADKFYEKEALMCDPVCGTMVASLLVGPCALEYSKMRTIVHNSYADPSAEELILRQRLQSRGSMRSMNSMSPKSPRRVSLQVQVKRQGSVGLDELLSQKLSVGARDYVMSLHQNLRSTLLYGKNNVTVQPSGSPKPLRGYLSLHQNFNGSLSIRWTPNELMHSNSDETEEKMEKFDKSIFWRYALNICMEDVVYLHCHHDGESGGSIVLVGTDGVQHPPIVFPIGQHPVQFLACLETGLLPWARLDPPLWLQKGKGKVLPRLRRRSVAKAPSTMENGSIVCESSTNEPCVSEEEIKDFVFRIVPFERADNLPAEVAQQASLSKPAASKHVNSRLVSLAKLSSGLRERFISLGSSPATSPPPTPPVCMFDDGASSVAPTPPDNMSTVASQSLTPNSSAAQISPLFKRHSMPALSRDHSPSGEITEDTSKSPAMRCLKSACDSMKYQILCRAFYGWLAHCRHLRTVRTHLACLITHEHPVSCTKPCDATRGLTDEMWQNILASKNREAENELYRLVYFGGVQPELRRDVWPFLLGLFSVDSTAEQRQETLENLAKRYGNLVTDWLAVEAIVQQRDKEAFRAARESHGSHYSPLCLTGKDSNLSSDVFAESEEDSNASSNSTRRNSGIEIADQSAVTPIAEHRVSRDSGFNSDTMKMNGACPQMQSTPLTNNLQNSGQSTPEEGVGGTNFSKELVETFALNLHRIEKDVHRCDRHFPFYMMQANLDKLKHIMCTYVWENLDMGYVQGMCDLLAPLLVVFEDEVLTYGCFTELMKRMAANFPHGGAMDLYLANMRSLLQVLDPELFELMHQNGDYTHFYFCYRWFLLDFKREMVYEDVFLVWETIWAARHVATNSFALFIGLALVQCYRDIILDNSMDFTDIIKFFNEMAEKHDAKLALKHGRGLVEELQKLIEANKR